MVAVKCSLAIVAPRRRAGDSSSRDQSNRRKSKSRHAQPAISTASMYARCSRLCRVSWLVNPTRPTLKDARVIATTPRAPVVPDVSGGLPMLLELQGYQFQNETA